MAHNHRSTGPLDGKKIRQVASLTSFFLDATQYSEEIEKFYEA